MDKLHSDVEHKIVFIHSSHKKLVVGVNRTHSVSLAVRVTNYLTNRPVDL